jgi:hypothetical protein
MRPLPVWQVPHHEYGADHRALTPFIVQMFLLKIKGRALAAGLVVKGRRFRLCAHHHRAMRRTVRSTVAVNLDSRRPNRILAGHAFAFDQACSLFLVRQHDLARWVGTDPRHHDIIDPSHEFVALGGCCHASS